MPKVSNWSGNLEFNPREVAKPDSIDAIVELVRSARESGRRVRIMGAKHSWMPLIPTDDILVTLDAWQGVESVDPETQIAEVRAGTRLFRLGEELYAKGYAMANLGDIATQSVAGALFTGTHGTGADLGILATQLMGITFVNGHGELVEWNEDTHPNEMRGARVSFGALGLVVLMRLKVIPAYRLAAKQYRLPLASAYQDIDALKADNRHFEFFWFPHTEHVVAKTMNMTDAELHQVTWFDDMLETHALPAMWSLARAIPPLRGPINKLLIQCVPRDPEPVVDQAHRIFPSPRNQRFQEMEYNIPATEWRACFDELVELYEELDIFFAVESRWVKGDDVWLSPASGRDSAYIAVHQIEGMPYKEEFVRIEEIFRRHDGRPHWGKLNTMTPDEARASYPKLADFSKLRAEQDPDGLFLNDYLRRMLT